MLFKLIIRLLIKTCQQVKLVSLLILHLNIVQESMMFSLMIEIPTNTFQLDKLCNFLNLETVHSNLDFNLCKNCPQLKRMFRNLMLFNLCLCYLEYIQLLKAGSCFNLQLFKLILLDMMFSLRSLH